MRHAPQHHVVGPGLRLADLPRRGERLGRDEHGVPDHPLEQAASPRQVVPLPRHPGGDGVVEQAILDVPAVLLREGPLADQLDGVGGQLRPQEGQGRLGEGEFLGPGAAEVGVEVLDGDVEVLAPLVRGGVADQLDDRVQDLPAPFRLRDLVLLGRRGHGRRGSSTRGRASRRPGSRVRARRGFAGSRGSPVRAVRCELTGRREFPRARGPSGPYTHPVARGFVAGRKCLVWEDDHVEIGDSRCEIRSWKTSFPRSYVFSGPWLGWSCPPPFGHRYGHNFSTWVISVGMAIISATWTGVTRIGTGSS